jgi:hypothetical protein
MGHADWCALFFIKQGNKAIREGVSNESRVQFIKNSNKVKLE